MNYVYKHQRSSENTNRSAAPTLAQVWDITGVDGEGSPFERKNKNQ